MSTQPDIIGILQNQSTNINFLNTHRFRVVLHRTPKTVYFVQECNLPGMAMGNATQPTMFVDLPVPGDKLVYSDFVMTFSVDENMECYKEISDWLTGLGFPKQFEQYAALAETTEGTRSDISLIILDALQNPKHVIKFRDAFPVSISDLRFNTKETDVVLQNVTAVFKYAYWELVTVNTPAETPAMTTINPTLPAATQASDIND